MVSGSGASAARQSKTKTVRRRGSDRQVDAGQRRDLAGPWAGGDDDGPRLDRAARAQGHLVRREANHLVVKIFRAAFARLAPEGLHQRRPVEPALVGRAVRGEHDPLGGERRKPPRQRPGVEQLDGAAFGLLDRVVGAQHRFARRTRQEEVARLLQTKIDIERLAGVAQEADAIARQMDVERRRELLADRARRQRRGGAGIARVALHHQHPLDLRREVPGDRGAHHPAADDDDLPSGGRGHARPASTDGWLHPRGRPIR